LSKDRQEEMDFPPFLLHMLPFLTDCGIIS